MYQMSSRTTLNRTERNAVAEPGLRHQHRDRNAVHRSHHREQNAVAQWVAAALLSRWFR